MTKLDTYYINKRTDEKYHILTYIRTKTYGMALLVEYIDNNNKVSIIPAKLEDFLHNQYEEITEDDFEG